MTVRATSIVLVTASPAWSTLGSAASASLLRIDVASATVPNLSSRFRGSAGWLAIVLLMPIMTDPTGPPYSYPEPLPNDAKQAHMGAVRAWQRRANWWTLLLMTGITGVIISVAWGNTRNSEDSVSLWLTNPTLAAGYLYIGLAITALAAAAVTVIIKKKNKHMRLLKAYGIHVDPYTNKITDAPASAQN